MRGMGNQKEGQNPVFDRVGKEFTSAMAAMTVEN